MTKIQKYTLEFGILLLEFETYELQASLNPSNF